MSYSPTGSILSKNQVHQSRDNGEPVWETSAKTTYQFDYKYEGTKPHAPSQIGENAYIYDASGERVIKATGDGQAIYINGFPMGGSGTVGNYTMYVNPFMVVSNSKYIKQFTITL